MPTWFPSLGVDARLPPRPVSGLHRTLLPMRQETVTPDILIGVGLSVALGVITYLLVRQAFKD